MSQTTEPAKSESIDLEQPHFSSAYADGTVTHESGYHQPKSRRSGCHSCRLTTPKGAYRDVTVEYEGKTVHYYHQNAIVVERDGKMRLSSCGWHTTTTKERLNRYLPAGFKLYQRDFDWYLTTPDGETLEFHDGMVIEPNA